MANNTRNTRWAVVKEVTEGTPVAPSAANQYVSLMDGGFELQGEFDEIENAEIKGSIGAAKSIRGFENPSGSYSHYLKHSGVEATKPEYDFFLESLFGTVHSRSTERDTVGGSTAGTSSVRGTLVVDTGEGAEYARGHIVLVKNATNGYSIRFVQSVSTDTLSLNFNLANAPASGVNLGKGITFMPADSAHPSLSIWDYRGNALTQMVAGAQVTEASISATAGELVQCDFSFEGLKIYHYPIEITSSSKYIDFTDDFGTVSCTLTEKIYRSPIELADEVASKMTAASVGSGNDTITCTYSSSTGKFTIASNGGTTFTLKWNTGANTANSAKTKLGFDNADESGGFTYTSDNALTVTSPYTPSLDSSSPIVAKNLQLLVGSFAETVCVEEGVQSFECTISVEKPKTPDLCDETGRSGSVANGRTVEGSCVLTMPTYEAQKFQDFISNTSRSLQFTFGEKSAAGNWEAGKSGALWVADLVYTTHLIGDADGIVTLELGFKGHVDSSGNGEVYLGFV